MGKTASGFEVQPQLKKNPVRTRPKVAGWGLSSRMLRSLTEIMPPVSRCHGPLTWRRQRSAGRVLHSRETGRQM